MPRNPLPKRTKLRSAAQRRAFCEAYARCLSLSRAARSLAIDPRTVRNERHHDPAFDKQIKETQARIYVECAKVVCIEDPKHWLAIADPKRWVKKRHVEIGGNDGKPIEVKTTFDVSSLTTDELRQLETILARRSAVIGNGQG